ncbi:hypothetical protein T06_5223 [Trichinella sp. T6]|nr:hypothetical protein T06_5223 [Trichinella sp. T6]
MTSKTGRMLSRLGTHRPITGAQSTQRIFSKATQNRNSTLQRTAELKLSGCHYEVETAKMHIHDRQFIKMPNSNSSVLSSFKLINVKMREDFFEDLLKNIGKYHLGKYCYNF